MKNLQLTPIANNMTQLTTANGAVVLFSYQTPVAALLPNGAYVKTNKKWSQTTTRHINKWLADVSSSVEELDQAWFDSLITNS